MKRLISILLILVTAIYVLPIGDGFMANPESICKYVDKCTDDSKDAKKDNGKEFIPAHLIQGSSKSSPAAMIILPLLTALPVLFTIETPPPDKV